MNAVKVLELEIHNVRGIRHLLVKPDAENFVIWGPNGSGKSAVVDALDFLLTGRMSRLTGPGTGDITLSRHGPHIDTNPADASVRAIVRLGVASQPIEISRCVGHPGVLVCDEGVKSLLDPITDLAQRRQHILTRREILRYITAEPSTRAEQIQELLNITDVEDVRKALVRVQNEFDKDVQAKRGSVEEARAAVSATVQHTVFQPDVVLRVVNQNRSVLGGQPISSLLSTDLKMGLTPPTVVSPVESLNVTLIERDLANLLNATGDEEQAAVATHDRELRASIAATRSDPELLRALSMEQLTRLGMALIDDTGRCPLCDTPWPPGKLRERLEQRLSTARLAAQQRTRIDELSSTIANSVNGSIASAEKAVSAARLAALQDALVWLEPWLANLRDLAAALATAVDTYPDERFGPDEVQRMLAPADVSEKLNGFSSALKAKYPESTPEQTAWDTLTRLEENLKALERAEKLLGEAESWQHKAVALLTAFQGARDAVLGALYEDIRDRFVGLYRQLHGADENAFTARIEPDGAALDFEVDFYGRGMHPPHALHSEGHQDSMGICLYLALAERLSEGLIELVILDDVMMSVDTDHRRDVCRLLATSFPGRQFLITTHDKTWANQLRSEGVVTSRGTVEFFNWSIDTGPQVSYQADMWIRIQEDLQRNDVPAAAARLRRGLEEFFASVCDALEALVTFKLNSRWDLGDYLPAAMGRYRSLLRQAKSAAQSWGDKERFDMLEEVDSTVGPIYARSGAEQWAVDANVHYNNWINFSKKDFRPVVEAFQDLCGLFLCSGCRAMLRVASTDGAPATLRCGCGKVDWNLVQKARAS
jgi:hypothetical protein